MDYKGKKFTDLTTGNIVEIKDHFEDIAILNTNAKIKVNKLLDKNYFEEFIDPSSFFNNESLLSSFAQKIKSIPDDVLSRISDDAEVQPITPTNPMMPGRPLFDEPAIIQSDPEMEKLELMQKYGIKDNPILEAQKQLERFQSLLQEDDEPTQPNVLPMTPENFQRIDVERFESEPEPEPVLLGRKGDDSAANFFTTPRVVTKPEPKVEDPIIVMFKNVKRNKDFKISLDIENKIPRPDFIEMMEDSYNTSIIEFLADEFTNNILENPNIIRDKIIAEIKRIVYGDPEPEVKVEVEKPTTTTKATKTTRKKAQS